MTINVVIHYPETEEGINNLINSQVTVMIDILENQIGIEKTKMLIDKLRTSNKV
ncbi:hypothetical protein [Clostridium nigeriense]|uniref:hypothetical protein n=1 Tax=Clostridium nigeriense TaxID=1805470 RepID=UPI000A9107BD|nr:hypothetical protein [Clostridium nigeriense]